jgi:hypothetical protein
MLDRAYPRARQDYDEAVYRALGLATGGKGVLRKTLIEIENRPGLYDAVTHTAYIRAGVTERAAALHEIVHALQDQRFDLRRVTRLPPRSDATLAATASIEGHARLVTDVLAKRRTASHGGPKLTRFLRLERGFTYDVGIRFAADLRNLGGQPALVGALRRFPETTEQVFHLDKYFEREPAAAIVLPVNAGGATLTGSGAFGELQVRALLAVFGVQRLDRAAAGWGGGRSAIYRGPGGASVALALDWDTEDDAVEWAEATAGYVDKAFDPATPGPPPLVDCAAAACWQVGGRAIALERAAARTALVVGVDVADAAVLARALLALS